MLWLITVASIIGTVLNVRRCRAGFAVWAFTNAAWFVVDLTRGIYAQAALMAVYFCLALWGWFSWRTVR